MKLSFASAPTSIPLKFLLLATLGCSLLSPWIGSYLMFSKIGIDHYYFWQFATYLLVHPFPTGMIHLVFNLFLIWTFGASLLERMHPKYFFSLYFGSGIFAALCAWLAMFVVLPISLAGSSSALYALLTAWTVLNPQATLLLFFAIPFKARHLLLTLISINLLIDVSSANWIPLFAYLGAILFGYLFTIIVCKTRSAFPCLAMFENIVLRTMERLTTSAKTAVKHTKIYDFKSGEPILSDEQFMDAMLARISLYGEDSLSSDERKRLRQISEKKSTSSKKKS